jgi:hypothetical protein
VLATKNIPENRLYRIMASRLPVLFEANKIADMGPLDERTAAFVRRTTMQLQDEESQRTASRRERGRKTVHGLLDGVIDNKAFLGIEEKEDRVMELAQRMSLKMTYPIPEIGDALMRMLKAIGAEETDRYINPRRPMLEQLMNDAERFGLDERATKDLEVFLNSLVSIVETAEGEAREEAFKRQAELSKGLLNLDKNET